MFYDTFPRFGNGVLTTILVEGREITGVVSGYRHDRQDRPFVIDGWKVRPSAVSAWKIIEAAPADDTEADAVVTL
ncbi:hypothetical protein ACFY7C_19465 [Streptomyces sp. NPDC012769]|uniref:hypothetical protein n=1 Tax=Streptomyces sp. NPDC012769 TaxID=3364848 RepID=UPI0036ACA96C